MKKIKSKKVLNISEMGKLYGGKEKQTSSSATNSAGCTVTTSDSFEDSNNNGKWDKGESGQSCTVTNCG
ncbi:hypothetical protein KRE40_01905 [Elizabethkingia meningoseptica]|uniref:hypothetical protein n=1 Tax=Elizabethkingia meningoseptica TaxID=238 RepID=UPI000332C713|nr:hypothetical protein [Elizabethkingia meningoseptica]AQX05412.1 hypothetical protein BBD33_09205 [Elizabethkingia meningoseptica]AQX47453.1 hypothetical protein B5G46_09195 [Elizabethkingia meningoseptica]EOR29697.1 hypothetical protein L100_09744 [Elizabethkingia meningoseptica ATCC 13253 = NBRC 12535]KUY24281.1 hypothetical protein ATB99_01910 [Elizabethkingia meningoseptica]MDE5437499.1 hypothetical protein [Elizabethkingia meningoseptica]